MTTLTDRIYKLNAPFDNPYQGKAVKALFVCSAGILRSATMANYYAKKGWNTRAAGTHDYALVPLTANLIAWADHIYFVNEENYVVAQDNFKNHPLIDRINTANVLDIPDMYEYNHPDLLKIIEQQMEETT